MPIKLDEAYIELDVRDAAATAKTDEFIARTRASVGGLKGEFGDIFNRIDRMKGAIQQSLTTPLQQAEQQARRTAVSFDHLGTVAMRAGKLAAASLAMGVARSVGGEGLGAIAGAAASGAVIGGMSGGGAPGAALGATMMAASEAIRQWMEPVKKATTAAEQFAEALGKSGKTLYELGQDIAGPSKGAAADARRAADSLMEGGLSPGQLAEKKAKEALATIETERGGIADMNREQWMKKLGLKPPEYEELKRTEGESHEDRVRRSKAAQAQQNEAIDRQIDVARNEALDANKAAKTRTQWSMADIQKKRVEEQQSQIFADTEGQGRWEEEQIAKRNADRLADDRRLAERAQNTIDFQGFRDRRSDRAVQDWASSQGKIGGPAAQSQRFGIEQLSSSLQQAALSKGEMTLKEIEKRNAEQVKLLGDVWGSIKDVVAKLPQPAVFGVGVQ